MLIPLKKFAATLLICLAFFISSEAQAKSLFGDYSCRDWIKLEQPARKLWVNAFLAPLSLTYKSINKTDKDHYNDNPNSYEAAINSINSFCESHSDLDATSGAMNYLDSLSK